MVQERNLSESAQSAGVKYHHQRACLFFGIAAVESFLNEEYRDFRCARGDPEATVVAELKGIGFKKKLTAVPQLVCRTARADATNREAIIRYNTLRGEITHPKGKDHALYGELDGLVTKDFELTVARTILEVQVGQDRSFTYWLLGWNFVGAGSRDTEPFPIHNQQFWFAMQALGFRVPAADPGRVAQLEARVMRSWEGYLELRRALDECPLNIEPFSTEFPVRPRLCRRWWDVELIRRRPAPGEQTATSPERV
jgi:hypothetical protein